MPARRLPPGPRRASRCARCLLAAALLVTGLRAARAEDERPLVVGVWVPAVPLASVADKADLVQALAGRLGEALGRPVTGRAYARAEDLVRDLPGLSFVLCDAPLAASVDGLPVLAVAHRGGRARVRLGVYAAASLSAPALVGRRLAYPRSGPMTWALLERVVLQRQVPLDQIRLVPVADAASALTLVRLGKADAALLSTVAHDVLAGDRRLHGVVASADLPSAVFCAGGRPGERALALRAREAVVGFAFPRAGIDGFVAAEEHVLRDLRTTLRPPPAPKVAPRVVLPATLERQHVEGRVPALPAEVRADAYHALGNRPGTLGLLLKICVTTAGQVAGVEVLRPSGAERLDAFVGAALRSWRYRPLAVRGRTVPFCGAKSMRVTIE